MAEPDIRADEPAPLDEGMAQLALRYREPLVRWFLRRGLALEAAEDCAQETFARICAPAKTPIAKPEAYLFAVAANVLMDRGRRAGVRHEREHVPIENLVQPSDDPTPARIFEGREALTRLAAVMAELPPRTREMFLLNRLDGLSYTQLAARFGVTVSAVEKRMMKAIAHLARRYRRDD